MAEYKTIGEVSETLNIPPHVLRFWETEFKQINPSKRRGGRRFYSEKDIEVIEQIRTLLHVKGYTIKGAKKALEVKNQSFVPKRPAPKLVEEPKPAPAPAPTYTAPPAARPAKGQTDLFSAVDDATKEQDKERLEKILSELRDIQSLMKSA